MVQREKNQIEFSSFKFASYKKYTYMEKNRKQMTASFNVFISIKTFKAKKKNTHK